MAKRTVHIPDDLDARVVETFNVEHSYSRVVQEALSAHLDANERAQEIEA